MPYQEWHGLAYVYSHLYRSKVVGQYCHAYRLVHLYDVLVDGLDESLVQILDSLQLQLQVAVVSGFVACLYVHKHKVVLLQRLDGSLCLTLIVGVGQSCGAFHLYYLQSGIVAYAANQVDSRNHRTRFYLRILLLQSLHRWAIAAAPGPYAVSLSLATLSTLYVEWVSCQQILTLQYQLVQQVGSLLCFGDIRFYQQWAPFLVGMIMGWGTSDVLVAALDYQQMAILYAGDKLYPLAAHSRWRAYP